MAGSGLPPKNFLIFLSQRVGKLPYLTMNPYQRQLRDPHQTLIPCQSPLIAERENPL